jgi:hypothetical protein
MPNPQFLLRQVARLQSIRVSSYYNANHAADCLPHIKLFVESPDRDILVTYSSDKEKINKSSLAQKLHYSWLWICDMATITDSEELKTRLMDNRYTRSSEQLGNLISAVAEEKVTHKYSEAKQICRFKLHPKGVLLTKTVLPLESRIAVYKDLFGSQSWYKEMMDFIAEEGKKNPLFKVEEGLNLSVTETKELIRQLDMINQDRTIAMKKLLVHRITGKKILLMIEK